jgi:hypothetical protein
MKPVTVKFFLFFSLHVLKILVPLLSLHWKVYGDGFAGVLLGLGCVSEWGVSA